jgi:dipeptidyl aminopeptidase/acylaminoacyl peptidase
VTNGKIAFARLTGSHWQIEEVNPDGSSANTLASIPGEAFHPTWSPDGGRIAFDVRAGAGAQILLVNQDGTGSTQLTTGPGWNYLPSWSPDGTKIAFVSTRDGNDEIYVMNADGTDQVRLTDSPDEDLSPSWAPDSSLIAFQSNRDGNNEIYEMKADGTSVVRLTDQGSFDGDPAWSPDGSRIAFASDRNGPGVYTMKPDGTDIVRLTHDAHVGPLDPAWSPDSGAIAFTSDLSNAGPLGVFVVQLSPQFLNPLPVAQGNVCCPAWAPWQPAAIDSPAPMSTAPPLVGPDLAEALGLKLLDHFPSSGCQYYVEVDNPKGYCLDSVSGSKVDHWVLGEELQGRVPTEAQIKCFSIMDKLGNWEGPTDSPEYRDLQQQFMDECRPTPEVTPIETSPSG